MVLIKEELIRKIYSKNYIEKMKVKLLQLGSSNKLDVYDFMIVRFLTSFVIFFVFLYNISNYSYVIAPIIAIIYYFMFNEVMINNKLKKRCSIFEHEAMHFFEVLTLSLETGRNLTEAIDVTTTNVNGLLSSEFKEAIRQIKFGKSLSEALNDLQTRIPSESVNNIILSLTQANLYGNSIIESLYSQIDYLREKKKLEVKGKISKVPVLISVISVFFFIPLLLIVILGPILLGYFS